jgi:hypothetical protein
VKIVRKVPNGIRDGSTLAVWLGPNEQIRGWWEFDDATTADDEIARYGDTAGWRVDPYEATECGTTLAALRAELEGGEG